MSYGVTTEVPYWYEYSVANSDPAVRGRLKTSRRPPRARSVPPSACTSVAQRFGVRDVTPSQIRLMLSTGAALATWAEEQLC